MLSKVLQVFPLEEIKTRRGPRDDPVRIGRPERNVSFRVLSSFFLFDGSLTLQEKGHGMTIRFRRVYVSKLAILRDLRSDLVGSESRRREEEEKREAEFVTREKETR